MKVIKTLSIINFFIFVTFNIKNESKYSNTFINNAYNMSIRRSMAESKPPTGTGGSGSAGSGAGASAGNGANPGADAERSPSTPATPATPATTTTTTTTNDAEASTSTSSENPNHKNAETNPKGKGEVQKPNQANKETQNNSNVQQDSQTKSNVPPTQDADTKSPTAQPEQAENSAPTAEQTESPELQSAPENKGTGQHGHMHGSRNNHPQNTSDSQKECTDGNKENCGAATSLLNNSSNIASINKFVVLISATLVLSFAIFI
ncbi:merozoite surface antigen 2, allelic form 1 [Plasmodium falciparum Palo Alto/Uganda]|uniref:Merozoite surface protein 2 n=3 Tax=Plasmodium falciparum TaxID=5833 RepID=MSA2_PLAFC|nr:RecName: Full=Merozoite surface protein 2; AltName: Full=Merozoite surface antigen 2; Short=MSA-2; Flags: Precursor [Plasmodium falciparum CAMP/Malaysia]AAA29687.1 merozoite surface antigen 2 [Plasmodium falciparum]ETW57758.1 merozoite surface antigen 2, allelic form 1 [Plasmodium falciparum Palo Alto/Uganda]ETW63970.1 merozoite surface antigen 2, allelic form 1 [Plasmodium falciparum CAMP/Malaysia]